MKWLRGISFLAVIAMLFTACNSFRPIYPATYTPPVPSQTHPVITLRPTNTPTPKSVLITPTPRTSALSIVWVINSADQTIIGIDPIAKQIVDTIQIDGIPRDIVTGEGGIWVIVSIDAEHSNLLRVDPYSRLASSHIPTMNGEATIVTAGEGFIWLSIAKDYTFNQAAGGGVEYSRNGAIMQVDPNPSKIIETFGITAAAADLFPEEDTLWVLANRNTYSVINKVDLKKQSVTTLPEASLASTETQRFAHFTKLGPWLWMTPQETDSPFIYQVSSSTGLIHDKIRVGNKLLDSAVQITQDGTFLWAALRSGKVVKMDPASLEVVKVIETEATGFTDLFFSSGFLWAIDEEEARVFQIDAEKGELVSSYSTGSVPPPRPTPTITETPNPDLIWALCNEAFTTQLQIGERAVVNTDPPIPNRIRKEAGGDNAIVGYIEPGEVVKILDGPICLSKWVWWQVSSLSTGLTGWTSEGDGVDYWLLPYDR